MNRNSLFDMNSGIRNDHLIWRQLSQSIDVESDRYQHSEMIASDTFTRKSNAFSMSLTETTVSDDSLRYSETKDIFVDDFHRESRKTYSYRAERVHPVTDCRILVKRLEDIDIEGYRRGKDRSRVHLRDTFERISCLRKNVLDDDAFLSLRDSMDDSDMIMIDTAFQDMSADIAHDEGLEILKSEDIDRQVTDNTMSSLTMSGIDSEGLSDTFHTALQDVEAFDGILDENNHDDEEICVIQSNPLSSARLDKGINSCEMDEEDEIYIIPNPSQSSPRRRPRDPNHDGASRGFCPEIMSPNQTEQSELIESPQIRERLSISLDCNENGIYRRDLNTNRKHRDLPSYCFTCSLDGLHGPHYRLHPQCIIRLTCRDNVRLQPYK